MLCAMTLVLLVAVQVMSADNIFNKALGISEKIDKQNDVISAIQYQVSQNAQQMSQLRAEHERQMSELRNENLKLKQNIEHLENTAEEQQTAVRQLTSTYHAYVSFTVAVRGNHVDIAEEIINMDVRLYLDEEIMLKISTHDSTDHSSSSSQVVSLCTAGQSVWVQAQEYSRTSNAARTNTFSGTLLRLV